VLHLWLVLGQCCVWVAAKTAAMAANTAAGACALVRHQQLLC
jgi:hypothetical protein